MVTVILVGAAMTAMVAAAAFVSVQDLRASTDDRRASSALAYAEAGIDRFILDIKRNEIDWDAIRLAGCSTSPYPNGVKRSGAIGNGTFEAVMKVYNPSGSDAASRFAPGACVGRTGAVPRYDEPQFFEITSTGKQPTAKRVVRQVIKITALGLPIGLFANAVAVNGTPNLSNISLVTDGDVIGRGKYAMSGIDPYYYLSDFWPTMSSSTHAPAAVHTTKAIYTGNSGSAQEHTPGSPLNCSANRNTGTAGQSQWDQSGSGGKITSPKCSNWAGTGALAGPPPTSKLTLDGTTDPVTGALLERGLKKVAPTPSLSDQDYLTLKDAAKQSGLYCYIPSGGTGTCRRGGTTFSMPPIIKNTDLTGLMPGTFVAYFEYEDPSKAMTTNEVDWDGDIALPPDGVQTTPNTCGSPYSSGVIIVRNGSFHINSGTQLNGLVLLPEGQVTDQGGFTINGTIIAKSMENLGNGTFQLNDCWLQHMPGPFLDITTTTWSEVDR